MTTEASCRPVSTSRAIPSVSGTSLHMRPGASSFVRSGVHTAWCTTVVH